MYIVTIKNASNILTDIPFSVSPHLQTLLQNFFSGNKLNASKQAVGKDWQTENGL